MTQTASSTVPYENMSREDLIAVAHVQQSQLQAIYTTIATPNNRLSPTAKLVQIAGKIVMSNQRPNEQGLVRFDMEGTAELIGMSSDCVGKTVKSDCTRFGATHEVQDYVTKKGQKCKLVFVNPDEPYWKAPQVADLLPENLRNLPGDERRCSCGETMRRKKRVLVSQETWICTGCGVQTVYAPVQENLPLDVTQSEEEEAIEKGSATCGPFLTEEEEEETCNSSDTTAYTVSSHSIAFDSIPEELKALKQWVVWKYETKDGDPEGKLQKIPYIAQVSRLSQKAQSDNPKTWRTFEEARSLYERSHKEQWKVPYSGLGFMFNHDYTGVDFDHCITEDGSITEQVQDRLAFLDSYSEVSYSGTGVHCIVKGSIPSGKKRPDIEMYDHGRFFVMTGNHLEGTPTTIREQQQQLSELHSQITPKPVVERQPQPRVSASCGLSDEQVLIKCRNGMNSERFNKLWAGDASDYLHSDGTPDHSRADAALCEELAYRSDRRDRAMIDRLFRQSGLNRPKWEREDYRNWTLDIAMGVQIAS